MDKNRLEAFSDGVIAIIITIMVLDLKVPHDPRVLGTGYAITSSLHPPGKAIIVTLGRSGNNPAGSIYRFLLH